jgi:hypothetical protein
MRSAVSISASYFTATSLNLRLFYQVVLDCFCKIFTCSALSAYPGEEITAKILTTIVRSFRPEFPDDWQLKLCKAVAASFSSVSGRIFVHGNLLSLCFGLFLELHGRAGNATVHEVTAMTCQEQLRLFLARYVDDDRCVPEFASAGEYAQFYSDLIVASALAVAEYLPQAPASIGAVDLIVIVRVFTAALSNPKHPPTTLMLCADMLLLVLNASSPFLGTAHFAALLRTDVHAALLGLALDVHEELADSAARLVLVAWRRFAPDYVEGLC